MYCTATAGVQSTGIWLDEKATAPPVASSALGAFAKNVANAGQSVAGICGPRPVIASRQGSRPSKERSRMGPVLTPLGYSTWNTRSGALKIGSSPPSAGHFAVGSFVKLPAPGQLVVGEDSI